MMQYLVDWINNFNFGDLWQWFSNLPLVPKIFSISASILTITGAVVSLVDTLPKVYSRLRGPVAKIKIKRFSLVEREPGLVDFQLDLCIHAKHGNLVVEEFFLKNKTNFYLLYNQPICLYNEPDEKDEKLPSNKARVKLAIPKVDFEFTQFKENRFEELFLNKLKSSQVDILGLQVPENSFKCLTLAGRLKGKIDGDKLSYIPLKNWSIILEYGKRKVEIALEPSIIDNSQTRD